MSLNVVSLPATTTIDLNKTFTMQGMFETVYGSLPNDPKYTITGISFDFLGMECTKSGVIDVYADIKDAISRLYNHCMKIYLEPIWATLKALLSALENIVGKLLDIDLTLPVLNLKIDDLFGDDLYGKLKTAITNLYYNAVDDLKKLCELLGIPFQQFGGFDSPLDDIANIVKGVMVSLWSSLFQKIKSIIDAIRLGLAAYDNVQTPGAFPPPLSTIWDTAVNAVLEYIITLFASGGPTIVQIYNAIVSYAKTILNKAVVTIEDILSVLKDFTLEPFGKPFDWLFPYNPTVDNPWKDINHLLTDIKTVCSNFIALILAQFIKAIDAILQIFSLSFTIPVITINYNVCAIVNE
jgi:phage-related protein